MHYGCTNLYLSLMITVDFLTDFGFDLKERIKFGVPILVYSLQHISRYLMHKFFNIGQLQDGPPSSA